MVYEPGDVVVVDQSVITNFMAPFLKPEVVHIFGQQNAGVLVLKVHGVLYQVAPLLEHTQESGEAAFAVQLRHLDARLWLKPMHIQPVYVKSILMKLEAMPQQAFQQARRFIANWMRGDLH